MPADPTKVLHALLRQIQMLGPSDVHPTLQPLRSVWLRAGCPGLDDDPETEPSERLGAREALLEARRILRGLLPAKDPGIDARQAVSAITHIDRAIRQLRSAELAMSFHHTLLADLLEAAGMVPADPHPADGGLELAAERLAETVRDHTRLAALLGEARPLLAHLAEGPSEEDRSAEAKALLEGLDAPGADGDCRLPHSPTRLVEPRKAMHASPLAPSPPPGPEIVYWTISGNHICLPFKPEDEDNPLEVPFRSRGDAQLALQRFMDRQLAEGNALAVCGNAPWMRHPPPGWTQRDWSGPPKHEIENRVVKGWTERCPKTGEVMVCSTWDYRVVRLLKRVVTGRIEGVEVTGCATDIEVVEDWRPYADCDGSRRVMRWTLKTMKNTLRWGVPLDVPPTNHT